MNTYPCVVYYASGDKEHITVAAMSYEEAWDKANQEGKDLSPFDEVTEIEIDKEE